MEKTFDFNTIGKRMPYTVPDGFFDKMEENIVASLAATSEKPKSRKTALRIALRSVLAVAAAIALFFVVQPLLFKSDKADFESVKLAFNNLSADDQDFLIQVYEEEEILTNDFEFNP